MEGEDIRIIAQNKKVLHDFTIGARWEAGLVLTGSEVKSAREGRVQLRDSFARFTKDELWLVGVHISPYERAGYANHLPVRPRKLLLNRSELNKLQRQVEEKGATLVPLTVYIKGGRIKVEIAIATGKKQHDKRAALAEREKVRELDRAVKDARHGKEEQ
jgi:SsrA-binding protein